MTSAFPGGMQLVVALFVDSWRQAEDGKFVVFEVCLRGEDNSQWSVAHRYSEFYQFHHEVVSQRLGLSSEHVKRLSSLFPPKNFLSAQDETFLNARARALDAYLQVLKHLFSRSNWNCPDVVRFFKIPELKQPSFRSCPKISTPVPEEFNSLMSKAERLFHALKNENAFIEDLDVIIKQLAELVSAKGFKGDQRRFYDFKREVELFRLKNDIITPEIENSFTIKGPDNNASESSSPSIVPLPATMTLDEKAQEQKVQLRFQDAILQDLESTVLEQKHLSIALAEEVEAQNSFLSEMQTKQDVTADQFGKSSSRVQNLK